MNTTDPDEPEWDTGDGERVAVLLAYFRAAEALFLAPVGAEVGEQGRAYDSARDAVYASLGELAPGVDGVERGTKQ